MKIIIIFFISLASIVTSMQVKATSLPPFLMQSNQLILVVTDTWESKKGILYLFERQTNTQSWKPIAKPWPIWVGKNGLAWSKDFQDFFSSAPVKQEGDGKSPAGVFTLQHAFGFSSTAPAGVKIPYLAISPSILCIADAKSKYYGQILNSHTISNSDWNLSQVEIMANYTTQYAYGIVVNYNQDGHLAQGGSCIFLHVDTNQGTLGCTAMPADKMLWLLSWLNSATNPVLVQLPKNEFKRLQKSWQLPDITRY